MAIATSTLAAIWTGTKIVATVAAVAGGATQISKAGTAQKTAKSQSEQAARIRAGEVKRQEALIKRGQDIAAEAEGLPGLAAEAAAIAAGRKKQIRRGTLATGPRGILTEPTVTKPGLLSA